MRLCYRGVQAASEVDGDIDIRAVGRARWGFLLARQSVSLGVEGEGEMLQLLRIREQADGKRWALLP